MKKIRVSDPAERDLDNIWYYIARNSGSIETANRVVDSITQHFVMLAKSPAAGRRRDEIEPDLRSFPAGNYLIYYRESGLRVIIFRVIHGMRDQERAWHEDVDE